jgi:hypothetical protein
MLWLQLKEWSLNLLAPRAPHIISDVKTWTPPHTGFLKLNSDGASKGYLGKARVGGVIRDSGRGNIHLYAASIGNTTNNADAFGYLE